jgi:electron transport complex protein RnfB
MDIIITAVISVTVIGLICAVMLAAASKVMAVKVDARVSNIRECLPGANCGACGYAGCDGYAAALVADGVKTNLCVPGGDSVSKQISGILGTEYENVQEKVAVIHCCGDNCATKEKMDYTGIETCAASKLLFGGKGACSFGCIGFGDCVKACPNGAICIENGIAHVDTRLCTGCGMCASVCPSRIISIEPDNIQTVVMCSNTEKGAVTRKKCANGCIACKKCERECPVQAIVVENNVAKINYELCNGCGHCAEVCPVKCIKQGDYRGVNNQ